ncbi:succinylglutamate desuccinylase/aspartoacylase family protein [Dactylosporangium sp. NPDC050688]|uniref:succinylglutamate desuccinylase/aspartoacylase family protein n=1 Tax=Dactylosporangium sp. NPDC050688 TaxID=3157217 RepID=UPI0033EDAF76
MSIEFSQYEALAADEATPPGRRSVRSVPVFTDLDGSDIALVIHAVVGARPGPVLALHTALHGSEWLVVDTLRRLVEGLDPAELSGAVLALPVANPVAFSSGTRNTLDESDSPDLNRSFGGEQTWIADQLGRAITAELYARADAVMDFHCGIWGSAMGSVTCGRDFNDPGVSERAFALATAFGLEHVRRSDLATRFPGPKSGVGYAGQVLGIPGVISEVGGAGFDPELEELWAQKNLRGIRGVLQELGVLTGPPPRADRILVYDGVVRVNPSTAGMLEPVFKPEDMMRVEVPRGTLLGRVWSPYTFEVVEELRAPVRGMVDMVCRDYPVRPGDWAYIMVDLDADGTHWVDRSVTT